MNPAYRVRTLVVIAALLCSAVARAQINESSGAINGNSEPPRGIERVALWPNGAPGATGEGIEHRPTIDIYPPDAELANGATVIVYPGGGYSGLAIDHEGVQIARWLTARGIAAFVVRYRLVADGYRWPTMLHDGQRAIRWVRHFAERYDVDTDRIGVIGFSAGGHLCSMLCTRFDEGRSESDDPIERRRSRPDFAVLCYPAVRIGAMLEGSEQHQAQKLLAERLLDPGAVVEDVQKLWSDRYVTEQTPPTFLFHVGTDTMVSPLHSVGFYAACVEKGVDSELHIYRSGGRASISKGPAAGEKDPMRKFYRSIGWHGVGLGRDMLLLEGWPMLLENWLEGLGVTDKAGDS